MARLTLLVERVLPLSILGLAVVSVPILVFAPSGLPRLRGLEREKIGVEEQNAELRREIDVLRGKVARLRDDPASVERLARDQLGFVRDTEIVFQFAPRR